jgi:hypothetical protein
MNDCQIGHHAADFARLSNVLVIVHCGAHAQSAHDADTCHWSVLRWPVVLHHFYRLGCLVGATGDGKEKPPEGTKPTTYAEKRS